VQILKENKKHLSHREIMMINLKFFGIYNVLY
jgi:hypothetical protein